MPRLVRRVCAALACALLIALPTAPRAEVAGMNAEGGVHVSVISVIVDDPNPIGLWVDFRIRDLNELLNPDGDLRGTARARGREPDRPGLGCRRDGRCTGDRVDRGERE